MRPIEGRVWKFGDNISADDGIILYSQVPDLGSFDLPALKAMCFTKLDPDFPKKVAAGDIVVAGSNFGHHSHPHACVAMLQSGVAACICESTDSAFIRKALNYGLPIVVCRGIGGIVETGDAVSIDLIVGTVINLRTGSSLSFRPFCREMIDVVERGSLEESLRARVAQLA